MSVAVKEQLGPGIYDQDGTPVLIPPPAHLIDTVARNPRVHYFSTLGTNPQLVPLQPGSWNYTEGLHEGINKLFEKFSTTPLQKQIAQDTRGLLRENPDAQIGIRGTACAIPDDIRGPILVHGVERILREGSDKGDSTTFVVNRHLKFGTNFDGYPVVKAQKIAVGLRQLLGDMTSHVYPSILVYDARFLTPTKSFAQVALPFDPQEREKAILCVYILDYACHAY